jgi:hypothetical protein
VTRSRPSTRSGAPTCRPTSPPSRPRTTARRCDQLAVRRAAAHGVGHAVPRRHLRRRTHRLPPGPPGRGPRRGAADRAGAPLRLRCVPRSHQLRASGGDINASAARQHIAEDVAAQAVSLLSSGATIRRDDGARPVSAGDLAVLVRTNAEAVQVHRALREVRVPAIINGVGSVFDTPAAFEWSQLLQALEQPTNGSRARAAALTSFLGWDAEQLANATDDDLADLHDQLHGWVQVLRDRGVASLLRTITVTTDLPARLLGVVGGERHLTDLDHIGQLLHRAAIDDELGPASLTAWLNQAITDTSDEQVPPGRTCPPARVRRPGRADPHRPPQQGPAVPGRVRAVPVVPGLAAPPGPDLPRRPRPRPRRRGDAQGRRGVGGPQGALPGGDRRRGAAAALRRTDPRRAPGGRVVVAVQGRREVGLGRVLFSRRNSGECQTDHAGAVPSDDRTREKLQAIVDRSHGQLRWRRPPGAVTAALRAAVTPALALDAATSTASSTGPGTGPPTRPSRPTPTRRHPAAGSGPARSSPANRRRASPTTRRCWTAASPRRLPRRSALGRRPGPLWTPHAGAAPGRSSAGGCRCRCPSPTSPAARSSARSSTRSSRRSTSPPPTCAARCGR